MITINRKTLVAVLLSFVLVLLVSAASASQGSTLSVADARAKIHPNLLAEVDNALANQNNAFVPFAIAQRGFQAEQLQFVARVKAGTNLNMYTDQWFARPYADPLGNTVTAGYASPSSILKMAANPDVISLKRSESLVAPPEPTDPDVESALARNIEPTINLEPDAVSPGPAPEGWYHTGSAIHGSQDAWAKGYTGAGVRYMSNDSGADYCHPDLHGTWAYIDDATSPYYGLPEMFDSYSSYQAAYDYFLGTTFVAEGVADYADTSATTTGDFAYTPIGGTVSHTYVVPGTSLSGEYHYGSHPDKALAGVADVLSSFFGDGTAVAGERAAVLVADENTAGVYDTVYVDLNYNFDFSDDSPARLTRDFTNQEAACLDYDADGLNDVSGGLVYFISDGATAVPTLDWFWGVPGSNFGNGDLVAFHVMDYTEGGGDHGMGTTSVAVGQGIVSGSLGWGVDGPPQAEGKGLVVGPGKDVASTQNGNFYISPFVEDAYYYGALGYDGVSGTGDDIQIISNSWGYSDTDNDGFDNDSQLIDSINRALGPNMALLFSTGNGAAGYGTAAPPSPATGIGIGASTLFDSIGLFESIESADQIVGGDVISWSNRGPGARNVVGADVVATGAFGTGSVALNQVLQGAVATDSFSGTSMAAPVAAGNLALIYQAWFANFGVWPTWEQAKTLLMNSATDIHHDAWSQGAGMVNSDKGTDIAGGHHGIVVSPSEWSVGDYRGTEYDAFAHIISPGESDTQTLTITNTGSDYVRVTVHDYSFKLLRSHDLSFTSLDQSQDHGEFLTPDYAMRIDNLIPKNTDLVQVHVTKPYNQFDPDEDLFEPFNNWRVHLQNWTDLNGDGNFWDDVNGNGKVDAVGEMDENEYIRFTYGYNTGPTQQARISNPHDRMADGILLTLRHRDKVPSVPTTDLGIELTTWERKNWSWVTPSKSVVHLQPGQTKTIDVTMRVPRNTPYGMYEGVIKLRYDTDGNEVIIPVTVAVAAEGTSFEFGTADKYAKHGENLLYENNAVYGYTDYSWRAESGDWRFFWTDIAASDLSTSGTDYLVVDNSWEGKGTDIDTIILGPTSLDPSDYDPSIYGPYTLEEVGRSNNTYIGSGRWLYDTSTGGPREIVAAPAQEGLHAIMFHQVRVDGSNFEDHFGGSVGLVNVDPGVISDTVAAGTGSASLTVSSEIEMGAFVANGYGLGAPVTTQETVLQDDPNDPSTASFTTAVNISNGALLDVTTGNTANGSDIDLYVYDPNGALVASSTTASDEEHVSILFPEDGTYTVAVHGWSVAVSPDTFDLTINAIQGTDVSVSNLPASIPAGSSATMDVNWDTTGFAPGTYYGLVLMGPAEAPGLLSVPVEITVP